MDTGEPIKNRLLSWPLLRETGSNRLSNFITLHPGDIRMKDLYITSRLPSLPFCACECQSIRMGCPCYHVRKAQNRNYRHIAQAYSKVLLEYTCRNCPNDYSKGWSKKCNQENLECYTKVSHTLLSLISLCFFLKIYFKGRERKIQRDTETFHPQNGCPNA